MIIKLKTGICFLIALFVVNAMNAQSSPIATGNWYKISLTTDGIYKLSVNELTALGFNAADLAADKIAMYSHYGQQFSENIDNRPLGLREIPIKVVDNGDGILNGNDYILFYGQHSGTWTYLNGLNYYKHSKNYYSDQSYYYITIKNGLGLRIGTNSALPLRPSVSFDKSEYLWFNDSDIVNPAHLGRHWGGESIGLTSNFLSKTISLPSFLNDSVRYTYSILNSSKISASTLIVKTNGISESKELKPIVEDGYDAEPLEWNRIVKLINKQITTDFTIQKNNNQSVAYLDYLLVEGNYNLQNLDANLLIRNRVSTQVNECEFLFTSANPNFEIWDISNLYAINALTVSTFDGKNQVAVSNGTNEVILAFCADTKFKTPQLIGKIKNSNITGENASTLIIIYPKEFEAQANELKEFKIQSGLATKTVLIDEIYNEYSTSAQELTAIRDYLRTESAKTGPNGEKLKFVLLFGSASYDTKNRINNNTNYIPEYMSSDLGKSGNFITDDYLAYYEIGKGIPGNVFNTSKMGFAVGRVIARNEAEAQTFVNKLKKYKSPSSLGPWRMNMCFIADDKDKYWENIFTQDSEFSSAYLDNYNTIYDVDKIYLDAYKQKTTGNKEEYPDVTREINNTIEKGCLFLNYNGHGGEFGWAHESILTHTDIKSWKQYNGNYPILFTATCEFSRPDDPNLRSGGELVLTNPNGGAIASFATTRLVQVYGNSATNRGFWGNYGFPKPNDTARTIGEMYVKLKNRPNPNYEDLKFNLLGDPSMTPNFPEHKIEIDSVNGTYVLASADTFKAFSLVKIKGHVSKNNGSFFADFNGNLWAVLYDKADSLVTLNNDQEGQMSYTKRKNVVYKGRVLVTNGYFTIEFVVPKDINYRVGLGRLHMYAHNNQTDAAGYYNFKIGGSSSIINNDLTGPKVEPFMNDFTFKYGDVVNKNSIILAKIKDLSGINSTGSGIGRSIVAILDEGTNQEREFVLNNYFSYNIGSYTEGIVEFPVENLTVGKHSLKIKAWDVFNNLGEGSTLFEVLDPNALKITEVVPYPNPFSNEVNIQFKHNFAGDDLRATLLIFDRQGKLVNQGEQTLLSSTQTENRLIWDGKTSGNSEAAAGIYIYKVIITTENGSEASFVGKIIKQ